MTRPNVVLVVMDTARAVDVPLDDGSSETMPFLRGVADSGTTFTDVTANAPWTLPSHGSLFSGKHPSVHGAHAEHKQFRHEPTLATVLRKEGYHTAAVSNNTWISGEFGFDRGFDEFVSTWQLFQDGTDFGDVAQTEMGALNQLRGVLRKFHGNPLKNVANLVYGNFFRKKDDDGARRTNRIVADRLSEWADSPDPFFLFLNYLEPHIEYDPPDKHAKRFLPDDISVSEARGVEQDAWAYVTGETSLTERELEALRGLYRAELAYLDERIEDLYALFDDAGLLDETLFIVTGDHGENIGDHGLMDHQYSLHETLLHVPLIFSGPGFDSGSRVESPVQILDLFPTILDTVGASFDGEDYPGRSLREFDQLPDKRTILSEYIGTQPSIKTLRERYDCERDVSTFDRRLWAVKFANEKYIRGSDGSERLFDLREDPGEQTDLSNRNPDRRRIMAEKLDERVENLSETTYDDNESAMDTETEQRLEDLGYLQ